MKKLLMLAFICGAGSEKATEEVKSHFPTIHIMDGIPTVAPAYGSEGNAYVCVPDREAEKRHLAAMWFLLETVCGHHTNDWWSFDPNMTREDAQKHGIEYFFVLKSRNDHNLAGLMAKKAQEAAASDKLMTDAKGQTHE